MPTPAVSTAFGDLLDPRFQRIFNDRHKQLPDMVAGIYTMAGSNGRNNITYSQVGAFQDVQQFTGTIEFDSVSQGYDTTITPLEWASGFQVERKLFDDDQFNIMDQRPSGLARASNRTRQKHAFRPFTMAFSVDTLFYVNTEAVASCSNSHTTTSGASTGTGFDNLVTSALSATAITAAKIQGWGLRDDRANRMATMWDELWYPPDIFDVAEEILGSAGKPDTMNNNINVHQGKYTGMSSVYMTDVNDWFLVDSAMRKESLFWSDRIPNEFAMVEDFDTMVAKWRLYSRYGAGEIDWRWRIGASVT